MLFCLFLGRLFDWIIGYAHTLKFERGVVVGAKMLMNSSSQKIARALFDLRQSLITSLSTCRFIDCACDSPKLLC